MYFGPDLAFHQIGYEAPDTEPIWEGAFDVDKTKPSHYFRLIIVNGDIRNVVRVRRNVLEYHATPFAATRQEIEPEDEKGQVHHFKGKAIAIDSCLADGEDIGAVRNVYWSGNLAQEKLVVRDEEKHTISYQLLDNPGLPRKGGHGTVALKPEGNDETEITLTADADEIDEADIQTTRMIFEPFIHTSITSLREILTRPAQPMF